MNKNTDDIYKGSIHCFETNDEIYPLIKADLTKAHAPEEPKLPSNTWLKQQKRRIEEVICLYEQLKEEVGKIDQTRAFELMDFLEAKLHIILGSTNDIICCNKHNQKKGEK